ncbi:MAG TPA: hypothetical protein CFH81_08770 [Sulfurovum sp. UBA12169]|nr:MAG TPA: hypothetical protein CFH81_08770 [Sulfurovum sp. UBA12169]
MIRKAKRWGATRCLRDIDHKFWRDDNEHKRVYVPEFNMLKSDLAYLHGLARRKKTSHSAVIEQMIDRRLLIGWDIMRCYTLCGRPRKHSTILLCDQKVSRRKYMMHPSTLAIVNKIKEGYGISYSVFFERLLAEYKESFPITI